MGRSKMKFICKIFGHKMYDLGHWSAIELTICERCEKKWEVPIPAEKKKNK